MTGLLRELREAYSAAGAGWALGPTVLYERLADVMVAESPVPLADLRVLDAGAGTGAVSSALLRVGARPIPFDLATGMLTEAARLGLPSAAADVSHLPLRAAAVEAVASGFCLNHVPAPAPAFAELRHVTARGGPVLVAVFATQPRHPAKAAVDRVADAHGFVAPGWYADMKATIEPLLASADAMDAAMTAGGFSRPTAIEREVDAGIDTPEALAAYRLGMAHVAPFLAAMSAPERAEFDHEVREALVGLPPVRPRIVIGTAVA